MTPTLFQPDPIQAAFDAFDGAHPEVFDLFRRFAWELRRAGRDRFSADAILHRIRWEAAVNPGQDSGFKVNDHFSSRYARKLMEREPGWDGFFETRRLRG